MTRVPGTPEWERENLQVSYPFIADPDAAAQTDGIRGSVVDATVSVLTYVSGVDYSLKVSRVSGVTSVWVYCIAAELAGPADIVATVVSGDFATTWVSVPGICQACVITTAEDFAEGTAVLLPGRVFPLYSGVVSLAPDDEAEGLSGEVILTPGDNLRVEVTGQEVLLVGEQDQECSVPAGLGYLATINGLAPDESGDLRLVSGSGGCLSVLPYPPGNAIALRNDCASPSPRKGRAASYEKLLHAAAIYHLIAQSLSGVALDTQEVADNIQDFIEERVEP